MIKKIIGEILFAIGTEKWVKRLGWFMILSPTLVDFTRSGITGFLEWTVCWKGIVITWIGAYILWLSRSIQRKWNGR